MRTAVDRKTLKTADAIFSLFHIGCSSCSDIERKLMRLNGIRHVAVDYAANAVLVSYDPDRLSTEEIREFLDSSSNSSMGNNDR